MIAPKNDLERAMLKSAVDASVAIAALPAEDQQLAHAAMDFASAEKMPLHQINDGNITQAHMMAISVGLEAAASVWRVTAEADFDELDTAANEAVEAMENLGSAGC